MITFGAFVLGVAVATEAATGVTHWGIVLTGVAFMAIGEFGLWWNGVWRKRGA